MRQLSDLALALGDYDTAASTLRLLASDTRADRAYKAYAGVQEALGAAAVLAGAPPSEAAACYKEALHHLKTQYSISVASSRLRNLTSEREASRVETAPARRPALPTVSNTSPKSIGHAASDDACVACPQLPPPPLPPPPTDPALPARSCRSLPRTY